MMTHARSTLVSCRLLLVVAVAAAGLAVTAEPAAAEPAVAITPATGLADGDSVTVEATGFAPGLLWSVAQCLSDPPADAADLFMTCDLGTGGLLGGPTDASGSASLRFQVRREFSLSGNPVDCAAVSCAIGFVVHPDASPVPDFSTLVLAPIGFDPTIGPNPPPQATGRVLSMTTWAATVAVECPAEEVEVVVTIAIPRLTAGTGVVRCIPGEPHRVVVPLVGDRRIDRGLYDVKVELRVSDGIDTAKLTSTAAIRVKAGLPPGNRVDGNDIAIDHVRRRVIDGELRFFVQVRCSSPATVTVIARIVQFARGETNQRVAGRTVACEGQTRVELETAASGAPLRIGRAAIRVHATIEETALDPSPDFATAQIRTRLPAPLPLGPILPVP